MGIGLIRVLLAFVVITAHTHPVFHLNLGSAVVAVRSFFIISGFYMAMILRGKYKSYWLFLTNRILRIYPIYWAVLLLTILAGVGAHFITGNWGEITAFSETIRTINPVTFIILAISNLILLGRDVISFTFFNPTSGLLSFHALSDASFTSMQFLLVPQAWTLVLEVLFYLVAPLIVNRSLQVVGFFFGLSLAVKWYLAAHGLTSVLWTYRFFPTELCYFLLGVFAFRLYERLRPTLRTRAVGLVATAVVTVIFLFYSYLYPALGLSFTAAEWIFYLMLTFLLPFIFLYSQTLRYDRRVGDLSYPVYISHILVFNVTSPLIFQPYIHNNNLEALFVFTGTIVFSLLLLKFLQYPIDRYREARVRLATTR